ncbi:tyrosine--tRNA ligase [Roseibium algae]|uniref:Tyrosine--tRNA ligase n=1 Tax=Roseibium algae TaxID=3123038 RepID=A0ABU8TIE7_9HYPH
MTQHIPPSHLEVEPRSEALQILVERGFVHQCTDMAGLDRRLGQGPVTLYAGFDATAASLHVGHLVPLMAMRWLQKLGHWPIIVLGGGTSLIGDPSFKSEGRPLLDQMQVDRNVAGIFRTVSRLFDLSPEAGGRIINNAEWLTEFRFLEFLRQYGQHFTVNRMISFDAVKSRLDANAPMTVLEFCYMMLQAVDFLELSKRSDCELQIGGSDQWGNIVNGVELGRKVDGRSLMGLTVPLLTTASGQKMGKTAAGAVWLDPDRVSPFAFWQFWRNTADVDVARFLKLFTELPMGEIARLTELEGAELNEAKKILATHVTAIVHGPEEARHALEQGDALFSGQAETAEPTYIMPLDMLAEDLGLLELLVAVDFAMSNGDARRLVEAGGVRLNARVVDDPRRRISSGDLGAKDRLTLAAGKRRKALVAFG